MEQCKEKLLDYLEKECESLDTQIENITSRAGITATLLTGIAFLGLENKTVTTLKFSLFEIEFSVRHLLALMFFLSIIPLFIVLIVRKRYKGINFISLYNYLYTSSCIENSLEYVKFYSELFLTIHLHNKKKLTVISFLYDLSMLFLFAFIILYICSIILLKPI